MLFHHIDYYCTRPHTHTHIHTYIYTNHTCTSTAGTVYPETVAWLDGGTDDPWHVLPGKMMAAEVRWLYLAAAIFVAVVEVLGNAPLRRFEYKYSFKPPYLAQKDGSVPFWEYGGSKYDNVTCFILLNSARWQVN